MSGSWAHSSGSLAAFISSRVTFISGASHGEHVSDGCTRGLILTGHAPGRGAIGPDSSRAALRPSSSALGPGFKVYAAVSSAMAARVGSPSAAGRGEETRTAAILARARNAVVVLARAARGGCLCGRVGSIVLRATFSPAAALLQLLVFFCFRLQLLVVRFVLAAFSLCFTSCGCGRPLSGDGGGGGSHKEACPCVCHPARARRAPEKRYEYHMTLRSHSASKPARSNGAHQTPNGARRRLCCHA
jgi:hypothetical protein